MNREILLLLNAGRIVALKADKSNVHKETSYILFEDKETIIKLDEQDPYTYHDCSPSARDIRVFKDKELWSKLTDVWNNNIVDADCIT